jgi:hypothetical protein
MNLPNAVTLELLVHYFIYLTPHPKLAPGSIAASFVEAHDFLLRQGLTYVSGYRSLTTVPGKSTETYGLTPLGKVFLDRVLSLPLDGSPEKQPEPEFDWSVLSPWFKYIAMDEDGAWWGYTQEPGQDSDCWRCSPDEVSHVRIPAEYAPKWLGKWEHSMTKRPAKP